MGWFCLLWTILFAVNVSCQNLTTLLPQDDDACMRNEVTFNCTVRGSQTLRDLVLAWSSPEYIGQGDPLRFTSDPENMPGMNISSMINGNVTATLISNTMIGGVPELVSELHVIGASQTSVITCSSESNQTSVTTPFVSSAYPGRPQIGEARERSAGSCDFQVTWDPPTNIDTFDIGRYIIYVSSRNMMNDSSSATIGLIIPNCRVGNNSIQVAAVNRFGCVGPNSSHIQLSLLEIPPDGSSDGLPAETVGGIVVGVFTFFFVITLIIVLVIYWKVQKQKRKAYEDKFGSYLALLYETLKRNISSSMQAVTRELLDLMEKKMSSNDIKEALRKVLETRVTSARGIRFAVRRLKTMIPEEIMSAFDAELGKVTYLITMDKLIALKDEDDHKKPCDELIKVVDEASPDTVKDLLQKLFEALQDYEEENELQKAFEELGETVVSCMKRPKQIKKILVEANRKLQVQDTEGSAPSSRKGSARRQQSSRDRKSEEDYKVSRVTPFGRWGSGQASGDDGLSSDDNTDGPLPLIPDHPIGGLPIY